jgi:uncharacterized protein
MIPRYIQNDLADKLFNGDKIVIIYGPRQVGKTTLVKHILATQQEPTLHINADLDGYIDIFSSRDLQKMKGFIGQNRILFIDEAQRIPNIGINLKILHDEMPELKIIVTGSSSFDLANKINEPLTGRTWTYQLFPISQLELKPITTSFELTRQLESFLLYGSYPGIMNQTAIKDKVKQLGELSRGYLYKDVLELTDIKHSLKIQKLLQLLALQTGSEVSYNELGNALQMSKDTVMKYIDLLEKSFVLFRLSGFSSNLRKEVTKMNKIYFYDNGIRNALINNFNPLDVRNDVGQLWENFILSERLKRNQYKEHWVSPHFWRTHTGAEIDYIENGNGQLSAFECKYTSKSSKIPKSWQENYPEATFEVINRENYLDFLG